MNNEQIDNTSYYELPGGGQLEDFIAAYGLSFAVGSALKYLWRAGKKDGEAAEKDLAKARHFVEFEARRIGCEAAAVEKIVRALFERARSCRLSVSPMNQISPIKRAKILMHYRKAVEKHPYFCDRLVEDFGDNQEIAKITAATMLTSWRATLARRVRDENATPFDVLQTEIAEVYEAIVRGDTAASAEECYDCIAVLLRMIDVLEGRQPLGRPKDGQEAAE